MSVCNIPSVITLDEFGGDYKLYENAIYQRFLERYATDNLTFMGYRVAHKKHPELYGKSATFWHMTSTGKTESERKPDLRRYERIEWAYFFISSCYKNCDNLLVWENQRKSNTRILVWCPEKEYLVIFDKRDDYIILWTAYQVYEAHRKKKLLKDYSEYKARTA